MPGRLSGSPAPAVLSHGNAVSHERATVRGTPPKKTPRENPSCDAPLEKGLTGAVEGEDGVQLDLVLGDAVQFAPVDEVEEANAANRRGRLQPGTAPSLF